MEIVEKEGGLPVLDTDILNFFSFLFSGQLLKLTPGLRVKLAKISWVNRADLRAEKLIFSLTQAVPRLPHGHVY